MAKRGRPKGQGKTPGSGRGKGSKNKQTIWLRVIKDVKLNCSTSPCIHHSEVKPLCVALGVDIILHK